MYAVYVDVGVDYVYIHLIDQICVDFPNFVYTFPGYLPLVLHLGVMAVLLVKVGLSLVQDGINLISLLFGNVSNGSRNLGGNGIDQTTTGRLELSNLGVSNVTGFGLFDIAATVEEGIGKSLRVLLEFLDGREETQGLAGGKVAGALDGGSAVVDSGDELVGFVDDGLGVAAKALGDRLERVDAVLHVGDDALDGGQVAGSHEGRDSSSQEDSAELHVAETWRK